MPQSRARGVCSTSFARARHAGTYPAVSFPKPGPGWLAAPDERTPGFFPAFARVSIAIQTLLRERVPSHYFVDPRAFRNVKTAYPMLVYRASRPFRGKMRTELTYDVLHPKTRGHVLPDGAARFRRSIGIGEGPSPAEGFTDLAALL